MTRTEFIVVTALILLAAFALGWFAHWLVHRFTRVRDADMGEVDRLAAALHDAEERRDQAIAYVQSRESELAGQLAQAEAELRAAMDGLRAARQEAHALQDRLEQTGRRD
ncbi:hypothetical protein [Rhodobaculum claviforme]|uniref:Uncharacterized protein n=1 Tax=Rhodobaculum claviforme TaxID=1549854 RepID=A0A934TM55_9RHOB|nr:hypothetical protein [Rhodobaculum claviforme]MBK5928178.1 hypothetical protein [Rhodobaculum claviforme]